MEENTIIKISKEIRDKLKKELDFEENSIDDTLDPVKPFFGKDEIKLIIIGQIQLFKMKSKGKKSHVL